MYCKLISTYDFNCPVIDKGRPLRKLVVLFSHLKFIFWIYMKW